MLVLDEADKLLSQDFKGMLDKVGHFFFTGSFLFTVTRFCFKTHKILFYGVEVEMMVTLVHFSRESDSTFTIVCTSVRSFIRLS